MSRETTVKPLGLITRPNKYGQYPAGALSACRNVCMRDKGVLTSMPARRSYRTGMGSSGFVTRRIFALPSRLIHFADDAGSWLGQTYDQFAASNSITLTPPGYSTGATFGIGKIQLARARDRYFVTSDQGPLVLDSETDTTTRAAGFPAPNVYISAVPTTSPKVFSGSAPLAAAWRVVWRRKFSDGYEVTSEPSYAVKVEAFDNAVATGFNVTFRFSVGTGVDGWDIAAGDIIEVYRTPVIDGLAGGALGALIADCGETYYLAKTYTVTAADITATFVTITDDVEDAALGLELYTNPGRPVPPAVGVGGAYVNTPPGIAADAWTFNGQTFYATTDLAASRAVKINTSWGRLNASTGERTTGIGIRIFGGVSVVGSNTVTGISAADIVGLKVGQIITGIETDATPPFPAGTQITAVGATTVTASANAIAVDASFAAHDVVQIDGVSHDVASPYLLSQSLAAHTTVSAVLDRPLKCTVENSGGVPHIFSTNLFAGMNDFGAQIIFRQPRSRNGTFTIRATNGANYSPELPEYTATAETAGTDARANRLNWSKPQQPEAVPPQQELLYGNGTHYRGIPTKDCTWLFASDGLYRLSGAQDDYRVDPVDTKLVLATRNAVDVLGDTIYAYTERGFVSIDSAGVVHEIARDTIGNLIPGAAYADAWTTYVTADELHREAWLSFSVASVTTSYVYSEISGAFEDVVDGDWTAMTYAPYLRSLAIAVGDGVQPDVFQFEADSSLTRMSGAQLDFQPLTAGDPLSTKQWTDVDLVFEGVSAALLSITPRFDSVAGTIPVTSPVATLESRARIGVPRSAAIANVLRPGFTLASGGTNNLWSLRALSARYSLLTEESGKR